MCQRLSNHTSDDNLQLRYGIISKHLTEYISVTHHEIFMILKACWKICKNNEIFSTEQLL